MFGIYPNSFAVLQKNFSNHSNVSEVKIYGSRAKVNYREGSDIDLVIIDELDNSELYCICNEIEESIIPYLVDISLFKYLKSESLKEYIDKVGKVFYEKK